MIARPPSLRGWFWRFTWPDGRAALALCGVCPGWTLASIAVHPGRRTASAVLGPAAVDGAALRVGEAVDGAPERLRMDLGDGWRVAADLRDVVPWPRPWPGVGPAGLLPGLRQYWLPHVLRARAAGVLEVGGETWPLDGATAYMERNWGAGFPPRWWWGEAHDFDGDPVTVAFAGGRALGPLDATALVVRVQGRVVRLGEPVLAGVRVRSGGGAWALAGRGALHRIEVEAEADPAAAHLLDVPVPAERRTVPWSRHHLAARLHVRVTRRGRVVYAGECRVAGLEEGRAP